METNNDKTTLNIKKEYGDTLLKRVRRYKARVEYEKNKELEWKIEDYLSYWICYGNDYTNILETITPLLRTVKTDDMKQFLLDRFNSILIDKEIEIGDIIVKLDDMEYIKKSLVPYIIEKIIDDLHAENNKVKKIVY